MTRLVKVSMPRYCTMCGKVIRGDEREIGVMRYWRWSYMHSECYLAGEEENVKNQGQELRAEIASSAE